MPDLALHGGVAPDSASYQALGRAQSTCNDLGRLAVLRNFEAQNQYYLHEGRSIPMSAESRAEVLAYLLSVVADNEDPGGGVSESAEDSVGRGLENSGFDDPGVSVDDCEPTSVTLSSPEYVFDIGQTPGGVKYGVQGTSGVHPNYSAVAYVDTNDFGPVLVPSAFVQRSEELVRKNVNTSQPGSGRSAGSKSSTRSSSAVVANHSPSNSSIQDGLSQRSNTSGHFSRDLSQRTVGSENGKSNKGSPRSDDGVRDVVTGSQKGQQCGARFEGLPENEHSQYSNDTNQVS